jgi:hypothetical protein
LFRCDMGVEELLGSWMQESSSTWGGDWWGDSHLRLFAEGLNSFVNTSKVSALSKTWNVSYE